MGERLRVGHIRPKFAALLECCIPNASPTELNSAFTELFFRTAAISVGAFNPPERLGSKE
jgi:hypothetical protein